MANYFYPPIIDATMVPQTLWGKSYYNNTIRIYYQDPVNVQEYQFIRAKVVKQSNNQTLARSHRWADGFIYLFPQEEQGKKYVDIHMYEILEGKEASGSPKTIKQDCSLIGEIIKIQLSYVNGVVPQTIKNESDTTLKWYQGSEEVSQDSVKNYAWLFESRPAYPPMPGYSVSTTKKIDGGYTKSFNYFSSLETATFSEWSTVLAIKFVDQDESKANTPLQCLEPYSLTPSFFADFGFTQKSKELKDKYKFNLYNSSGGLLESSGWLQYNTSNNESAVHRFKTRLVAGQQYKIKYWGMSVNGYKTWRELNNFVANDNKTGSFPGNFLIEKDYDNGCFDFYYEELEGSPMEAGSYVIIRASEKDNFQYWEDLFFFELINPTKKGYIFTDYTIESGVAYKYQLQRIYDTTGFRSDPKSPLEEDNSEICMYLPYAYLYGEGVQLNLKFNHKINSYKNVVLAQKQDALGSKYPTILRNGNAYYAEFPVNGMITLLSDENNRFFTSLHDTDDFRYKNEIVINGARHRQENINTNLTDNNFYMERIFREKVEEFLNNGNLKIYRSPIIGNHIVTLMNVSISPVQQLGGMVAEFSATAYEVLDFNLETILRHKIIDNYGVLNEENNEVVIYGKLTIDTDDRFVSRIKDEILGSKYSTSDIEIIILNIEQGYSTSPVTAEQLLSNEPYSGPSLINVEFSVLAQPAAGAQIAKSFSVIEINNLSTGPDGYFSNLNNWIENNKLTKKQTRIAYISAEFWPHPDGTEKTPTVTIKSIGTNVTTSTVQAVGNTGLNLYDTLNKSFTKVVNCKMNLKLLVANYADEQTKVLEPEEE